MTKFSHKNQSLVTEATRRSTTKGSSKSAENEKKKKNQKKKPEMSGHPLPLNSTLQ